MEEVAMQVVTVQDLKPRAIGTQREGDLTSHDLLEGEPGSRGNFRMILSTVGSQWSAPRHRHNFEQLRFIVSGEIDYGKGKVLRAGQVAYFGEGVPYGPQVRKAGTTTLEFQFAGASGSGYVEIDALYAAKKTLAARGTFENGAFTYTDPEGKRHNKDAFAAMWEEATGRVMKYPKPRYGDMVIIDPASFSWLKEPQTPGVERKCLGTFTECETRVSLVKMAAGATALFGSSSPSELLFLTSGAVSDGSRAWSAHSAFDCDTPVELKALEASELLSLRLPRL
jgi:hypothetical protein